MFHPDCLRTVFFGLFYLTWMFKVFRSLLLILPMNPKYGKTWACQLPSMKHFSVVVFFVGRGGFIQVFQTRCRNFLLASVCGLSPLWFTGIFNVKQLKSSVLFTLKLHWHLDIVSKRWKHCEDVFFFISTIDLECESEREYSSCLGGKKIHHSYYVKACIDFFFCIHYQNHFSAGLMYWLLCNSWTKHRLELIFKEKKIV